MPPRYEEWLTRVFEHEVREAEWYFEDEAGEFYGSDAEIVELFTWTMTHCGTDLLRFSDDQVGQGFRYIFNGSCSNYAHTIRDGNVALEQRLSAIRSIKHLYVDCFAERCQGDVRNARKSSPLGGICYMLWDVTCLNYWEGNPDQEQGYEAVVDVLEAALQLKNPACIESALHGLGHTMIYAEGRCKKIIRNFIVKNANTDPDVLFYAREALSGCIL